jgi:hypothetical protein
MPDLDVLLEWMGLAAHSLFHPVLQLIMLFMTCCNKVCLSVIVIIRGLIEMSDGTILILVCS